MSAYVKFIVPSKDCNVPDPERTTHSFKTSVNSSSTLKSKSSKKVVKSSEIKIRSKTSHELPETSAIMKREITNRVIRIKINWINTTNNLITQVQPKHF